MFDSDAQTLIASSPEAKRLIGFYRHLGMTMGPVQTEKNGRQSVTGRCDGFIAKFIAGEKASREPELPLCFLVADVASLMQRLLAAGGRIVKPIGHSANRRIGIVADPEGRQIKLIEKAEDAVAEPVEPITDLTAQDELVTSTAPRKPGDTAEHDAALLDEPQMSALRRGATMILISIVIILAALVIMVLMAVSSQPQVGRRAVPPPIPTGLTVALFSGAVLQVFGKLVLLRAGNAAERIVLMIAVAVEIVGAMARWAAMMFAAEPHMAAIYSLIAAASNIGFVFLCYFFRSVTRRVGDSIAEQMSLALFLVVLVSFAAITGGAGARIPLVLYGGLILCFGAAILYVALLIRLMRRSPTSAGRR